MKKLGFGCMRFPTLDGDSKQIDKETVCRMFDAFLAAGFTYVDTAYPYHGGQSELAVKECLVQRYPRSSFLLADKLPMVRVKSAADLPRFFDEQIEKCGVEYFDYYLLHNLGKENYAKSLETNAFDFLRKVKAEGRAKHVGFSFHDTADVLERILTEQPDMDFVQLQINYFDWESISVQSRQCLEVANRHGVPVVVMEPVKGGGLADPIPEVKALLQQAGTGSPASWAIRFAASQPGVFMVLSGMSDEGQLQDNMRYMADFVPLTAQEQDLLLRCAGMIRETGAVQCTACQYCVEDCPMQINIPALFAVWNTASGLAARNFPTMHYQRAVAGRGKAGDCIGCRVCEGHCPQHLPISTLMKDISAKFDK